MPADDLHPDLAGFEVPDDLLLPTIITGLNSAMSVIMDAVNTFRAECMRDGYSAEAAEAMAVQMHAAYVQVIFVKPVERTDRDADGAG